MRPGSNPNSVTGIFPFSQGTCSNLDVALDGELNAVYAGISKNGMVSWIVRGAVIEVINTRSQTRQASWQFGASLKDTHTTVTCVKEYSYTGSLKLLVGVSNVSLAGMLCVFDVSSSRVVKAIEIPHKVTSVEPITNSWGDGLPVWTLNEQLRHYCGIVAVGTHTGQMYLVDMCLDEEGISSDEIMPNKLHFISPRTRDIIQHRKKAVSRGQQLAMALDEEAHARSGFQYHKPDGSLIKCFKTDAVSVTCMHCIPQMGSIAVGFSFGCFQIWKLYIPVLEYSSQLDVDYIPITHFAYQEPENDPRNFCYLWVGRSSVPFDIDEDSLSSVSLYQLSYNKRSMYSNYGVLYEELASVSSRIEFDLTSRPLTLGSKSTISSRIISCYTLEDCEYKPSPILTDEESFEESSHGPDLSLCVMVWEWTDAVQTSKTSYHLGVFDLNRWYHAQMPPVLRSVSGMKDTCPYFVVCNLEDVIDVARPDSLLAVHVGFEALRKFINNSPMPPEQHFYPLSLAFGTVVVMESGIVKGSYLGTQRQVLADIKKNGPTGLISPKEMYSLCLCVGLLPRPLDISTHNSTVTFQRESLLNLALEYNMVPFITSCISQWAPGEFVHQGCTLKFLLDWAWNKVAQTKHVIDTTCVPLYDWSGIQLDQRSIQTLYQSYQRLIHLVSIFKALISQSAPTTEQGLHELNNKLMVVTLVCHHLQMVLWFLGAELLPEQDEADKFPDWHFTYPSRALRQSFSNRRQQLQHLDSNITSGKLLMIDGLIEHMGPSVKDLFDREGADGMYPPPSLHALLNVYLLDGVDLMYKHSLVLYLLLDLVSLIDTDSHDKFAEQISKFARAFSVPVNIVKQTQGFWLLDHQDFEEAMVVMLDPQVSCEMGAWQHYHVIKSLLYQGDCKMALRYLNTARPALTTAEQVKLKLTVLLANGLTSDALEYQRTYKDQTNERDLLYHLFLGCQQTKTVDHLLQLPLWDSEMQLLVEYLTESTEPQSLELLVFHYLQQSRFVEAVRLNEKLKNTVLSDASARARERAAARNAMVEGYTKVLPRAQRKLIFESQSLPKRNTTLRREVRRPQPLSTNIARVSQPRIISQASLISVIMEAVHGVKAEPEEEPAEKPGSTEPRLGPFICTPVTPRRREEPGVKNVVYPKIQVNDRNVETPTVSRRRSFTPHSTLNFTSPPVQRRSKYMSVEALAVLQTPVVERKTPAKSASSVHHTPQSILKVKHFISNSPSPQTRLSSSNESLNLGSGKNAAQYRLGKKNRGSTSQTGTPRSVSFAETSFIASPKQLRFADTPLTTDVLRSVSEESLDSIPSVTSVQEQSSTAEHPTDELGRRPIHFSEPLQQLHERDDDYEDDDTTSVERPREIEDQGTHEEVDVTEMTIQHFQGIGNEEMTEYIPSHPMSEKAVRAEIADDEEEMEAIDASEESVVLRLSESDSSVHSITEMEEIKTMEDEDDILLTPTLPGTSSLSFSSSSSTPPKHETVNISKCPASNERHIMEEIVEVTTIIKKETVFTEKQNIDIDLTQDDDMSSSDERGSKDEFKIPSPPSSPMYGSQKVSKPSFSVSTIADTTDSPDDIPSQIKTVSTDRPLQIDIPQVTDPPFPSPRRSPRLHAKFLKKDESKTSPTVPEHNAEVLSTTASAVSSDVENVTSSTKNVVPVGSEHVPQKDDTSREQESKFLLSPPKLLIKQEHKETIPKTPPRGTKANQEHKAAILKTPPLQSKASQEEEDVMQKTPTKSSRANQVVEAGRKTPPRKAKANTNQELELRKTPPRKAKDKQLENSVQKTSTRKTKEKIEIDNVLIKTPPRPSRVSVPLTPPESSEDEPLKSSRRSTDGQTTPLTPTRRSSRLFVKEHKSENEMDAELDYKPETQTLTALKPEAEKKSAISGFHFSDPMQVECPKSDFTSHLKPMTPIKSFIFSPPITRSHPRLKVEPSKEEASTSSILLPVMSELPDTQKPSDSIRKTTLKKGRKKVDVSTPSNDDVVLISPANAAPAATAPHAVIKQQTKPHAHRMTLRTAKHKKKVPKLFLE